ncbi:MAG: hypothetical protein QOJ19_33, partial [Acidimicrobiia bacterium]|nr:hypothetical protein [Acidimicrobiia bacterium]
MEGLPRGTVTFLFTDIESSSTRWESDPVEMRAALARHDAILAEVIGRFGGAVFKHLGDGLCAAFGSASSALSAGVTAQGLLQAEPWPGGISLAVRMGVHTGEIEPRDGDYFGPAVNRVARVMDVANGGQIVCSAATASLCREVLLLDAGEHELRGVGTEHLHLVVGDAFRPDPRPLRTVSRSRSNVPARVTSFVGRAGDVAELVTEIDGHRLVTLIGVGGVGKTSLALAVARQVLDRFKDGVWLCELAPVGDSRSVPAAVADALGARSQPGMSLVDSILDYLRDRHALIVLDNCEHLDDAAARLAERIVVETGVTVLATSRSPLGVGGERVWAVNPLEAETSGVELFADRARDRDCRFILDDDSRRAVEEICRRLDGIPLAIELAAARARAMSPSAIAQRLDHRFRLLRGGRKGARHETLHDTLRWSYELLSAAEAALFDRLSVFAGGFTLESVEAVCADLDMVDVPAVLDLLTSLVDRSMVVAEPTADGDRFRLLETLREYGTDRLAATSALDTYRAKHASWFRDVALEIEQQLWTPNEATAWRTIEAEWDNLRTAFSTALGQDDIGTAAEIVGALGWCAAWTARDELFGGAEVLLGKPGIEQHPRYADLCGIAAWTS